MNKTLILIGLFVLSSFFLIAQPAADLKKYEEAYPGMFAVILDEKIEMHFEMKDGELFIYEDVYEKTFYMQDLAGYMKENEIPYSTFSSIENIKATTYIPGPKKYKVKKVKEFKEKDELSASIFHDDTKFITYTYEGLQKGAMSEMSYRRVYKEPRLLGSEYLQSYIPVIHKTFVVIVDDAIEIGIAEFNLDQIEANYTERIEKGKKIYTWEVANSEEIKSESMSPSIAWYGAHVIPYVKSYTSNGDKTIILNSTSDLFNWYNDITNNLNEEEHDPVLQALVDSIIVGAEDELDVVRKIFYWTQDNIKYIAIEYGMGGFIPREADYVCENRYGDCKDMASTITHLLAYAGVDAHLTWIGTNKLPYRYSEIPTPVVDNHMIATYIDSDGDYYFLDATGRYSKFGLPSAFIQGKEAMIKIGENEYEIVEVPRVKPNQNRISEKVHLYIDGSNIKGNAVSLLDGYHKTNFEYNIENLSTEDKMKFYKAYFSKGNNKFIPENFTEENLYPNEKPIEISYDFRIDDYIMTNEDEVYINMNLDGIMGGKKIEKDRVIPIQNKYKSSFESENILTIPTGWDVDYVPESIKIDNDFIFYESSYEIKGEQLILHQKTNIRFMDMEKHNFDQWNESIGAIKRNQNEIVIIKQKNE